MWLGHLESEVRKEDFVYRLFLARFGRVAKLHFVQREVRAKITPNSADSLALINLDLKIGA